MWIKIYFVFCCFFVSFDVCSSASIRRYFGSYSSDSSPPTADKEYTDYIGTGYWGVASRERRKGIPLESTTADEPLGFSNPLDDYGQTLKRPRRHTDSLYTHQANIALRLKAASLKRRFLHRILTQNQRTPLYIRRMLAKFRLSRH